MAPLALRSTSLAISDLSDSSPETSHHSICKLVLIPNLVAQRLAVKPIAECSHDDDREK